MREKMPNEINGRPVHLSPIYALLGEDKAAAIWRLMHEHISPGTWFKLADTTGMTEEALKTLYNALYQRIYGRALGDRLKMRVSRADGICFTWVPAHPEKLEESEQLRRKRLDKKNELKKKYISEHKSEKRRPRVNDTPREAPVPVRLWPRNKGRLEEHARLHYGGNVSMAINVALMVAFGDQMEDIKEEIEKRGGGRPNEQQ